MESKKSVRIILGVGSAGIANRLQVRSFDLQNSSLAKTVVDMIPVDA